MKVKTLLLAVALMAAQTFGQDARLQSWARHVQMRDESPFRGLRWQSLGPRFQGGRVETIDAVPGTGIIYVGFGSGSIWKTTNHGLTWTPIFDDQPTYSIGDLAVSRSHPSILYVGTGENLLARSSLAGVGVFKSTDGGATWTHLGLSDTHHIGRVAIHPINPDIVFVATLGHLFTPNEERGLFRTRDGGKTWKKVLYVSDRVGAVDVVMDPSAPDTIYASTNEHDRKAWNSIEHGEGSDIYKSVDGGETWKRLAGGLPGGPYIGRIGLAVAPSAPHIVYAFLSNQTPVQETRPEGKRTVPTGPGRTRASPNSATIGCLRLSSPAIIPASCISGPISSFGLSTGATTGCASARISRPSPGPRSKGTFPTGPSPRSASRRSAPACSTSAQTTGGCGSPATTAPNGPRSDGDSLPNGSAGSSLRATNRERPT